MKLDASNVRDRRRLNHPFHVWLNEEDVTNYTTKVEVDVNGYGRIERLLVDPDTKKIIQIDGDFVRYWEHGRVRIEAWE